MKSRWCSFGQWEISVIWGLGVAMAIYLTRRGFLGAPESRCYHCIVAVCLFRKSAKLFLLSFHKLLVLSVLLVLKFMGFTTIYFSDFEQTHHIVRGSVESVDIAGTFSTYPNPHINFVQAFAVEMVITAILMGPTGVNGRWQRCTTRPFGSLADWSTDCGHWRINGPIDRFCHEPSA